MFRTLFIVILLIFSAASRAASTDPHDCLIIGIDGQYQVTQDAQAGLTNCYGFDSWAGDTLQVAVLSKDNVRSKFDSYHPNAGRLVRFAGFATDSQGVGWGTFTTLGPTTFFTLTPTTTTTKSKDINLSLLRINGVATLLITVFDTKDPPPAPPAGGGGTCTIVHCLDPLSQPGSVADDPAEEGISWQGSGSTELSASAALTCSAGQRPHKGKPRNFAVNEHLMLFERLATLPIAARLPVFVSLVAPQMQYDLKNNDYYKPHSSSPADLAAFGNWFYGAAAAAAGIDESMALRGAAAAQQFQDAGSGVSESVVASAMAAGAYASNTGDNPDDPPLIKDGHSYGRDIYKKDPDRARKTDSCATTPTPAATHGFTGGGAGEGYAATFRESGAGPLLIGDPQRLRGDASYWRQQPMILPK